MSALMSMSLLEEQHARTSLANAFRACSPVWFVFMFANSSSNAANELSGHIDTSSDGFLARDIYRVQLTHYAIAYISTRATSALTFINVIVLIRALNTSRR